MEARTVYLDSTDPYAIAAGPVSITGVYLRDGYEDFLKDLPPKTERERILEAIDKTFERPKNDLIHYFVWPSRLNAREPTELISQKAEVICSRLYYRSKELPKYYTRKNNVIPASVYRPLRLETEPTVGCYIARWINNLRREQSILNHYVNIYPEYELEVNKGYKTERHLDLIIEHGPRVDFHLEHVIDFLPKYYLSKIKGLKSGHILSLPEPPKWWSIYRPNKSFYESEFKNKAFWLVEGEMGGSKHFRQFLSTNTPFTESQHTEARKSYRTAATEKRRSFEKLKERHVKLQRTRKDLG
jgi:hypothetical protein